jgi:hypothetical protein
MVSAKLREKGLRPGSNLLFFRYEGTPVNISTARISYYLTSHIAGDYHEM